MITLYEGKKYLRVVVSKKRETDKYGKTHSVTLNDWKPGEKKEKPVNTDDNDDLPF